MLSWFGGYLVMLFCEIVGLWVGCLVVFDFEFVDFVLFVVLLLVGVVCVFGCWVFGLWVGLTCYWLI